MQNQTEDLLKIYNDLKQKDTSKLQSFISTFKLQHKSKKKLAHKTFLELKRICRNDFENFIRNIELSKNEAIIVGRALMQTKLKDSQNIIDLLCEYKHSNVIILTHFLTKGCKLDLNALTIMIENNFEESVDFLKLVLIIYRNYRVFFSVKMEELVMKSEHPICVEIKNNL